LPFTVFCKTFFPKVAKHFSIKLQLHFPAVDPNQLCPPSTFKIAPPLALGFADGRSYQQPSFRTSSARAAPGWLLITASGA
jgi:hypothetical protein